MVKLRAAEVEEDDGSEKLTSQVFAFFIHTAFAVAAWAAVMAVGYLVNPTSVPQIVLFVLAVAIPLVAGYIVVRFRPNETAAHIWLAGVIWILMLSLWVIDLPTGPNACNDCSATVKIVRTLFSYPSPSGLMDDNGPFFGTWPALATVGYSIGAALVLKKKQRLNAEQN